MKKLVVAMVLAFAGALCLLLIGRVTQRSPDTRPTLTIPLESDIQTLDPSLLSDPTSTRVVWQIYEGLVGLTNTNEVAPVLAESWRSEDGGRRWVFCLRKTARFQQNPVFPGPEHSRPVLADDVVYSYQRLAKGFGSFVFQGLVEGFQEFVQGTSNSISGIKRTGEREITFVLSRRDPSFIFRITSPYLAIIPHELVEANPNGIGLSAAVGTGPFQLVSGTSAEVILKRNPQYYLPTKGNIQRVVFRVEKNQQFRITGFRAGMFNVIQVPPESRAEFFNGSTLLPELDGKYTSFTCKTFNVHYLGLDFTQVRDPSLRRAISLGINRKEVESLLDGNATVAPGPVPPGMQGYVSHTQYVYDVDRAKAEVARSSYRGDVLTLLVSNTPSHSDVAQVIQKDLLLCGVQTRIEQTDFNSFVARLFGDHRPQLFLGYSEWIYSAPELVLEQFRSTAIPNPNVFAYSDVYVDSLLTGVPTVADRDSTNQLCEQIESAVSGNPPAVWLYNENHSYLARSGISGFMVTGNNHWRLADVRMGNGE